MPSQPLQKSLCVASQFAFCLRSASFSLPFCCHYRLHSLLLVPHVSILRPGKPRTTIDRVPRSFAFLLAKGWETTKLNHRLVQRSLLLLFPSLTRNLLRLRLFLFISGASKPIGQRHGHHRLHYRRSSAALLPLPAPPAIPVWAINSIARSIGILTLPCVGQPSCSSPAADLRAGMQIGHILVAVVGLQPRRGKLLRHRRYLVLQLRAGGQVAQLANIHRLASTCSSARLPCSSAR